MLNKVEYKMQKRKPYELSFSFSISVATMSVVVRASDL